MSQVSNFDDLLYQFELILDSDPLIDEVGFIHPSQLNKLSEEAGESHLQDLDSKGGNLFWNKDHKLGISTSVVVPLYKEAKKEFMDAVRNYREVNVEGLENEVMKHSKAVLLLSCDFGTAWNSRKLVLSKKQELSMFLDELVLSALVLSYSHKSEQAWCHRRWVIKMIAGKCSNLQEIVEKESELVEKIAERSKMNYRAWNHRSWLVSYMTREKVLHELKKSRNWAALHVADNSCFHYRTKLILGILESCCDKQQDQSSDHKIEVFQICEDELEWNEALIKRYIGREALWLYRRFLSFCWMREFLTDTKDTSHHSEQTFGINTTLDMFLEKELYLVKAFSIIHDNDYEDFQAQAIFSSTYLLWLAKQIPESMRNELQVQKKLSDGNFKMLLNMEYPERSSLWSNLIS